MTTAGHPLPNFEVRAGRSACFGFQDEITMHLKCETDLEMRSDLHVQDPNSIVITTTDIHRIPEAFRYDEKGYFARAE